MAHLLLFGPAREAAGAGAVDLPGENVGAVVSAAVERFGEAFAQVAAVSRIWLNGDPVATDAAVGDDDEVAVLPPVSGG